MTTRRPLQPLSPPTANIINSHYTHARSQSANEYVVMESRGQEDTHDLGSVVSGLSSLEDGADDFDKLMIQNARDERRLNEALNGRVQAFRKARTHPRVGLTIDNLERNNARNTQALGVDTRVKFERAPSSSGSARSDPAIHVPAGWGRKGRTNRNWMRTITYDEEDQQTPVTSHSNLNSRYSQYQQHSDDADVPRHSVEDSPLSHKSSIHGTPHNDRSVDWDLTFELNEASIIASTPYIPRNTVLDDIRQREIECLREQAEETAQLEKMRENSPVATRRPQSSSNRSVNVADGDTTYQGRQQGSSSPGKQLHKRTNSWQSIGKSQPVTGTGRENSPITVYSRNAEAVENSSHEELGIGQSSTQRPKKHWREDSQDLLRRLARVSNTPSPGRVAASRPQSAPSRPSDLSSQAISSDMPPAAEDKAAPVDDQNSKDAEQIPAGPQENGNSDDAPRPSSEPARKTITEDVDATPMPIDRPVLNPKTPVVTGAWVDTPGPRTIRKALNIARSPSQSPKKGSPRKGKSLQQSTETASQEATKEKAVEAIRPQLPSSALQALVQEAKAKGDRSADYGDSTINSLEDLIHPPTEGEIDEDTLQGLQLPTGTPRNEAERQRQQELLQLHRMNDRLRAARTSIRDVSRGMKRVEDQVEHGDEGKLDENKTAIIVQECPCATGDGHFFSMRNWFKSLYYDPKLSTRRAGTVWSTLGGLTGLSVSLIILFTYWISEEVACEMYCHHPYTSHSPYPFGVNPDAPQYPFVIPTLIYRNFIRLWWLPLWSFITWISSSIFGIDAAAQLTRESLKVGAENAATQTAAWAMKSTEIADDITWEQSMMSDEVVR